MPRARNIKPQFFKNEELVELPFETRLLFVGLWTLADREGRLEDRPKRIKMEIFPADSVDVDECLESLHSAGFILRYSAGEKLYIQILKFSKHQNPHKNESASTIPAPEEHGASTVQAPEEHSSAPADSLNPDSLNPDSLNPDSLNPESSSTAPDGAVSAPPAEQPAPPAKDPIPYQGIVDLYHENLPELRRVVELSAKRKAAMRQRHGGQMGKSLDNWRAYFEAVRASDFLMGRIPGKDWVADFDFLIRESAMISLLEGKYHEKNRRSGNAVGHPERAPTPAERVAAKRAAAGASDLGAVVSDVGNVRPHLVTGSGR